MYKFQVFPRYSSIRTRSRFYAALNSVLDGGDTGPMEEIWSHGRDVSAMHPFGGRMVGWDEVGASWEQAAQALGGSGTG